MKYRTRFFRLKKKLSKEKKDESLSRNSRKKNRIEYYSDKKLKFGDRLIKYLLFTIIILVFAQAYFQSEFMDDAFKIVVPNLFGIIIGIVTYYFGKTR